MSAPPSASPQTSSAADARWFTHEVHAHESQLKAYLRGSFPAVRDVEDVIQESYLRIWRARMAQPIRSTKSFLFQVARNLALDLVRRERVSPIATVIDLDDLGVMDPRSGVVESACTQDEVRALARAIHTLPARCREVIVLRQIDGLSQKEIALKLGISVLTVQAHVVNGLRRIEQYFLEHNINRWP